MNNSKYTGEDIEKLLDTVKNLSKEDLEKILTGNVLSHAHDTEISDPECDILNVATLEEDIQNLMGDGSSGPLSGSGTKNDPYIIDSALKWVVFQSEVMSFTSNEIKQHFKLTVNCDLSGLEMPVSTSTVPGNTKIQYSLDGYGHFIRNFILTGENAVVAPFPVLGRYDLDNPINMNGPYEKVDAQVKGIGFKDAIYKLRCDGGLGNGAAMIAGIGGLVMNTTGVVPEVSAIQNCYMDNVQLNVENSYRHSGTGAQITIASLCGLNIAANIKDCYAKNLKVNVSNVDSAPIVYSPFGTVLWTFDHYFFENVYTETTIKSNQGVTQEILLNVEKVIFNNCFYCSNYVSATIPIGVEPIGLTSVKSLDIANRLGEQFAWDRTKNDSYPYLLGQSVREVIYDGYVRGDELKTELEKIAGSSSGGSSGALEFPFELIMLENSSTSDEIFAAAGGTDKLYQLTKAAQDSKNCVCLMKLEDPEQGTMAASIHLDVISQVLDENLFMLMITFVALGEPSSVKSMIMIMVQGGVASLEVITKELPKEAITVDGSFINNVIGAPYSKKFSSSEILGWFGGLEKFCKLIRSFSDAASVAFRWRGSRGNRILSTFDYYWYNESLANLTLPIEPDYNDLAGIHQRYIITISCGSSGATLDLWRDSVEISNDVLKLTNTSASDTIINAWNGLAELQAKWEAIKRANRVYVRFNSGSSNSTEHVDKEGYCIFSHHEVVETTNNITGEKEIKLCLVRSYLDITTSALKTQRLMFINRSGVLTASV